MGRSEAAARDQHKALSAMWPGRLDGVVLRAPLIEGGAQTTARDKPLTDYSTTSSSPRRIRQNNIVAALQALFDHGQLSRAELARKLGLNRSSSGQIVAELTATGLVREVDETKLERTEPTRAGRPGILLELDPDAAIFLGVEIGVEHITTVDIDLTGRTKNVQVQPFDGRSTDVGDAVERAVEQAFGNLLPGLLDRCEGIGVSVPAQFTRLGQMHFAPILGWRDVDLNELIRGALPRDMPVMAENDANAFAIGEIYKRGEGRTGVTLFLVLESGVGGGIVIEGTLFRGGHGLAGEIGHMLVPGTGEQKLEHLIGLESLLTQYRAVVGDDAQFAEFLKEVRDRVPHAVEIAEGWARNLGYALVQTARLIDPNRIVLGGSVAALYPLVDARVEAHIRARQEATFPIPEIVVDDAAGSGSAFGAACMLHQRFLSLENDRFADTLSQTTDPGPP